MINIITNCYSNMIKLSEIFFKKYQYIINSIYCNKLNVTKKDSIKNESNIIHFIRILTSQHIRNEYEKYINLKKLDVTKIINMIKYIMKFSLKNNFIWN